MRDQVFVVIGAGLRGERWTRLTALEGQNPALEASGRLGGSRRGVGDGAR